jgi:uncharacterized membrane protein
MAGVLFGFSAFIMKGLARLPPAQGIAAMQSINVAAINPWFMVPLFGTALACVILAVSSVMTWHKSGAVHLFVGSLLYLAAILVTIALNVPRNDALAAVDPATAEGAKLWGGYVGSWTAWNHVRTAAALGAAAVLTVALCRQAD